MRTAATLDVWVGYAYPRRIEFVENLPKTLTGKIRRIELRRREKGRED